MRQKPWSVRLLPMNAVVPTFYYEVSDEIREYTYGERQDSGLRHPADGSPILLSKHLPPGAWIEVGGEWNLIGHVNMNGGMCDDCPLLHQGDKFRIARKPPEGAKIAQ